MRYVLTARSVSIVVNPADYRCVRSLLIRPRQDYFSRSDKTGTSYPRQLGFGEVLLMILSSAGLSSAEQIDLR